MVLTIAKTKRQNSIDEVIVASAEEREEEKKGMKLKPVWVAHRITI